ncbi:Zn-dependent amino-or carboxypeptidase, M28 family [Chitinophaga sp. YR627]|uniref:M28 family metallopeptidase n=1 Tax=Chitinophaga sp. YR627 TaxID=1881041 RepID=UPI0008EECA6D|nr:M28 family metallopeptidase [Chitinophaga sp. YR627]SFO25883.1 Zn-dependent amino-or carboxypeptidase, M28 family [Chitinophaga sp. YR627]
MKDLRSLLLLATLAAACNTGTKQAGREDDSTAIKAIDSAGLVRDISVLASDEFQGRKPFTIGEEKTLAYLEKRFKEIGLEPGNGTSYLQDVPMVEIQSNPDGDLRLKGKNGDLKLSYLDQYVAGTKRVQDQVSINNSEMIFAGFGIVAPEYNWNDYAGLDVKGKTVVVMVNDPGFYDSTLFKGKTRTMTYYGRWTYKFEEAARQGAAGILIIHDVLPASYGWTVVRSGWSKPKLDLQTADNNMSRAAIEGWLTQESAKKLFQLAGVSDTIINQAKRPGFKPVSLGVTASLTLHNKTRKSVSHNVAALLPGTDRKNEYIIYSAHWDHLGVGEAVKGDTIYNGALDNASGVSALLQLASAFKKLQHPPKRSVLFLALTGEEQGLLGSEYYATHPIFPIKSTVADINMDVLNFFGRTKDITIIGKGQSDLDDYAAKAAEKQGRFLIPEANPSGGWFFRSDHFNFAKVGIPALYPGSGNQSLNHDSTWAPDHAAMYGRDHYHSPFDQLDPSWELSGMVEDVRFLFDVGVTLSNEDKFPQWKEGSEFKAKR